MRDYAETMLHVARNCAVAGDCPGPDAWQLVLHEVAAALDTWLHGQAAA